MHNREELGKLAARHAAALTHEDEAATKDYQAVVGIGTKLAAEIQQLNANDDLTPEGKQRCARELTEAAQTEAAKVTAPRFDRIREQLETEENWTEATLRRRLALDKDPVRAATLAAALATTLPARSLDDLQALLTDAVNAGEIAKACVIHDALTAKLHELQPEERLGKGRDLAALVKRIWPDEMRTLPVLYRKLRERYRQIEHQFHRLSEATRIVRAPASSPESRLREARQSRPAV